ncbi:2-polyprenyl-6-methoxyphenol hydroxylase-like FAD-dependent oxidoreductase [Murinocardiopsis flavida]|uniref:2-polyprenyl-6-methoxyphenol hydroxylase-like FAD-dependent oxidoreductase n=2 Tax=Murinocardiopsis flavida TaxID=645275 RepID=A0A2P8CR99_9ACTN|nr:2-polyprenyl-6-methoxyphenol hydroxylase-like FAD-dependent oxidoreductase [Murinocardiopsis flavida]
MILVVGAGPTGLTLAIELARRAIDVRIIDSGGRRGSRGKGLQPRTLEVFNDLGVIDDVLASGAPYPPMRVYSGDGTVAWEGHLARRHEPGPDVPYPNVWLVPQWRTEEILRSRLARLGVHVESGTELLGFTADPHGVTARLSTGEARADYMVGCDGGHSLVRRELGIAFAGETHESERMLLADVRAEGLDRAHWHAWGDGPDDMLALCPLPGTDRFQLVAALSPGAGNPRPALPTLQDLAGRRATGVRLLDAGWISLYRVNIRMAHRFRVGRVLLAGDAAHVHSPAGGQGLNTGVQDAYNLGWKLAAADRHPRLVDTYEAERLPVAAHVLGLSTAYLRRSGGARPIAQRASDTRQLDLTYLGGPLAPDDSADPGAPEGPGGAAGQDGEHAPPADGAAAPLRPGDRAPDAPVVVAGNGVRLFDVFRGPHFTLLAFGPDAARAAADIDRRYGPELRTAALDEDGQARRAYGVSGDRLVLVRPDGHIAATAPSGTPAPITRFLEAAA